MEQIIGSLIHSVIEFGFEHQLVVMTLLGGVVPTLIWLIFWLREDECYEIPDANNNLTLICESKPRSLLFITFLCGAMSVIVALFLQKLTQPLFSGLPLIVIWAAVEEVLKYSVFWLIDAHSSDMQGPADPLVFLSVTALGFSAAENSLFLYEALTRGDALSAFIGQNYRFLGASLLHVLSSGLIGICIGYTYFAGYGYRKLAAFVGIVLAIVLHSLFNYLIIMNDGGGLSTPAMIWGIGIVFLLLIEGLHYLAVLHKKSQLEQNI
jgi:RsiW-degrading membrane proteinase PrsW (M82 family)